MTLSQLEQIISSYQKLELNNFSKKIFDRIGERSVLISILQSILDDTDYLKLIANQSIVHNLGFIRIVLVDRKFSNYVLKLHIWNLNDRVIEDYIANKTEAIHNHVYDFASMIVSGKLFCSFYKESPDGKKFKKYKSPLVNGKYSFNYVGDYSLKLTSKLMLQAGSTYYISHEIPHIISSSYREIFSTISIHGENQKEYSEIYTQDEIGNEREKALKLSVESLKLVITDYIASLQKN